MMINNFLHSNIYHFLTLLLSSLLFLFIIIIIVIFLPPTAILFGLFLWRTATYY